MTAAGWQADWRPADHSEDRTHVEHDPGSWTSALTHVECARCETGYEASIPQNVCTCGSPLLARYDLEKVAAGTSPAIVGGRPATLWRYRELLPVRDQKHVTT